MWPACAPACHGLRSFPPVPSAYRLVVAAADVDASAFAIATEAGRRLLAAGHAGQAAASIKAGLDLWRGPAYAEFAECRWLEAEATRLDLMRLDALQWRISAELLQADAMPPVAELEGLVREHPTREPLWALLMRALYRSGRQADALEAYQRARRILVSELGVEPGSCAKPSAWFLPKIPPWSRGQSRRRRSQPGKPSPARIPARRRRPGNGAP